MAKELNDENFDEQVAKGVTLVDFTATWCGPCRMLAPVIEELAEKMGDKASVVKVDIDASQSVTARFDVTSVPTIVLLKDGQEVGREVGLKDLESLEAMVTAAL